MKPILNQDMFWGGEVYLATDVVDPDTQEVRWCKGKRLSYQDVIDMLTLGIAELDTVDARNATLENCPFNL